jgi:hypothetical protein
MKKPKRKARSEITLTIRLPIPVIATLEKIAALAERKVEDVIAIAVAFDLYRNLVVQVASKLCAADRGPQP